MNRKNIVKAVLLVTLYIVFNFLIGCGGGGGGGGSNSTDDGGSPPPAFATNVSQGQIEGFGSVFVNGVEWETDSVEIEIEGSPGFSESDLQIGMLVKVEGNLDASGTSGTATTINYDDNLEGPISSITPSSTGSVKTLLVMGQTVIVENGVTFFDDSPPYSFAAMAVGDVIEVSGSANFDGSIQATFIEKKADDLAAFLAADDLEIQGVVAGLADNTFQINALTIDFSTATVRDGTLANGVLVEVKGNALAGNTLTATDVEVKPAGLGVDDVDEAQVEGFVTNLNTAAQTFEVNGQLVDYSTAAFIGGTEAELLDGTKVEAEGPIVAGELQAEKVEFEESIEFEANAVTVNAGIGTLTLEDLAGITVVVDDALTEFEPAGSSLSNIVIGDEVKIRAREGSGGAIVAIELEILDQPSDRAIIQGPVDSFVSGGDVTILGVAVDTTTIDEDDFKDNDTVIGRAAFFNRLAVGDLVKARFRSDAWDQIEFED
jgi:hypothetical protein